MAGFVYIMSNPSFANGLIKIGKSDKDPEEYRKAELNSTGVPEPFKVEYSAYVQNHHELEDQIHRHFQDQRPNIHREFFTCPIMDAISAIRKISGDALKFEEIHYAEYEEYKRQQKEHERQEKHRHQIEQEERMRNEEGERFEKLQQQKEDKERGVREQKAAVRWRKSNEARLREEEVMRLQQKELERLERGDYDGEDHS